jgi:hypothetical protein
VAAPRVQALRAAGADGGALRVTLRHFRKVVALEAVVGLLVLVVVPFLSGSAPNQDFQAHGAGGRPVDVAFDAPKLGVPAAHVLAKAPAPEIKSSTWLWGAGWVIVVLLALVGAGLASRRLATRPIRSAFTDLMPGSGARAVP